MTEPTLIEIQASDTLESAASRFAQQPDVVILLLGSFDASIASDVRSVCERAIAPVALLSNALIVDNGSSDGLSGLMGQAARRVDQPPTLLGIFSPDEQNPDPNHPFLMRLPTEWPDPARARFRLSVEFAKKNEGRLAMVALLFGGSDADKLDVLCCARRGVPLLVMQGAGGLGDCILAAMAQSEDGTTPVSIEDPDLREILDTATIWPIQLRGNTDDLKRVLIGPMQQPGDILANAWSRYDDLDLAAVKRQRLFRLTQLAILFLAVIATSLAIAVSYEAKLGKFGFWQKNGLDLHQLLRIPIILIPITISLLVGFNARFREGNKWILLRAAAESIKREIFRYRSRSGVYSEEQCTKISAPSKLAANIKTTTSNLVQSEVNRSSLPDQSVTEVGRMIFLAPEDYVRARVDDQIRYFVSRTENLYIRLKWMQFGILLVGGLGTFLAAIDLGVWVALTTAVAAAITNKLEIDQVENSLVQYNIALADLRNIKSWWIGLSPWEKTRRRNIDLLVDQTELTLEHETSGWVQQMQSTLDKLTEKEANSDQQAASKNKA